MSEAVTTPAPTTETPTPQPSSAPAPAPATVLTETAPAAPAAPVVPEKYEFQAPVVDGKPIEIDGAALGSFETAAREAGLSQDQFAKISGMGAQLVAQKVAEAIGNAMPEFLRPATQEAWVGAVKSDPEIGGDKLQATLAMAAQAMEKFGTPELREALSVTRAGNHPALVKFMAAVGRAMDTPGQLMTGAPAAASKAQSPEQVARDFYNKHGGNYPPVEG